MEVWLEDPEEGDHSDAEEGDEEHSQGAASDAVVAMLAATAAAPLLPAPTELPKYTGPY